MMEATDVTRLLKQMREAQVTIRRVAIAKRDMTELRHAQSDIESIDRAMADESALAKQQMAEEAERLARQSSQEHVSNFAPVQEEPPDPRTL